MAFAYVFRFSTLSMFLLTWMPHRQTLTQTNSLKAARAIGVILTSLDLSTLPYETRQSNAKYKRDMKLFDEAGIRILVEKKAAFFGTELLSLTPRPRSEFWDRVYPTTAPLRIREYFPTLPSHVNDSDPESIVCKGEYVQGPVTKEDACLLYDVSACRLDELEDR